jgi:UDP-N-acetylmuramyl pentapeptide synthase
MKKILVKLYLLYLKTAAQIQLYKIKPSIIALTGSVGKTSLRNAIVAIFQDKILNKDKTFKKSVKANSETGIPLDILGLHPQDYNVKDWLKLFFLVGWQLLFNWQKYEYYIVELGVDDPLPPKNMDYLLTFINPDIAVFLNVAPVHTMQFAKIIPEQIIFKTNEDKQRFLLKEIAGQKGKILTSLSHDKTAIVNADDQLVLDQAKKSKAKKYYFGKTVKKLNKNALKIQNWKISTQGTEFNFQFLDKIFKFKTRFLLPQYYGYTMAAAILTGIVLNYKINGIIKAIEKNFRLPPGRMSVFTGIKNTTIIDSSYNASKASTIGALELLAKINKDRKKAFVFGDMRELGSQAKTEHQQVAQKILDTCDYLVLIGPLTKKYVLPVVSTKIKTLWFKTSYQAADYLKKNLSGHEVVLIKGSQNTIFTEIVVAELLKNKQDQKLLCRQSSFWEKQRQKLKNYE